MRIRNVIILTAGIGVLISSSLLLKNLSQGIRNSLDYRTSRQAQEQARPLIIAVSPWMIRCDGPCIIGNIKVSGSGFALGQRVSISVGKLLETRFVNSSQLLMTVCFDAQNFSQGYVKLIVSGPGGSISSANMAFFTGRNMGQNIGTQLYSLDQGAEMVHVYDASTISINKSGSKLIPLAHSCFVGASLANGIAADDSTGLIGVDKSNFIMFMRPDKCQITNVFGLWPSQTTKTEGDAKADSDRNPSKTVALPR